MIQTPSKLPHIPRLFPMFKFQDLNSRSLGITKIQISSQPQSHFQNYLVGQSQFLFQVNIVRGGPLPMPCQFGPIISRFPHESLMLGRVYEPCKVTVWGALSTIPRDQNLAPSNHTCPTIKPHPPSESPMRLLCRYALKDNFLLFEQVSFDSDSE